MPIENEVDSVIVVDSEAELGERKVEEPSEVDVFVPSENEGRSVVRFRGVDGGLWNGVEGLVSPFSRSMPIPGRMEEASIVGISVTLVVEWAKCCETRLPE